MPISAPTLPCVPQSSPLFPTALSCDPFPSSPHPTLCTLVLHPCTYRTTVSYHPHIISCFSVPPPAQTASEDSQVNLPSQRLIACERDPAQRPIRKIHEINPATEPPSTAAPAPPPLVADAAAALCFRRDAMPLEAAAYDALRTPTPDAVSLAEEKDIEVIGSMIESDEKADSIRASRAAPAGHHSHSAAGIHEPFPPSSALPSAAPSVSDFFDPNLDVEASWFGACLAVQPRVLLTQTQRTTRRTPRCARRSPTSTTPTCRCRRCARGCSACCGRWCCPA